MLTLAQSRHHLRPAAEAAVLGWLAVLMNDWDESMYTRPKGSMYSVFFIGSLPSLALGVMLAVRARTRLIGDVSARVASDGELPPPHWVVAFGIKRGLLAVLVNVWAYLAFWCSHPARVVASFLLAAIVGGAWLARSVIVREYPERVGGAYASFVSVIPGAMLAVLATSAALVVTRMSLDNALLWAFDFVPMCGGVEMANATITLLPPTLLLTGALALALFGARRLADPLGSRRIARMVLGLAFVGIACVAFAVLTEHVLLATPPRACRNTPYATPLEAILHQKPASFLRTVLWSSGALGGALGSLVLLLAERRRSSRAQPMLSELGPYRSPALGQVNVSRPRTSDGHTRSLQ